METPENARYVRFYMVNAYGNTYKNDICINLSWNGTRNGEYEPYEKRTYLLTEGELYPATTLRGVPVVENSKVKYDGDIYNADGTVERRYGVVDLGTLTYTRDTSAAGFVRYVASPAGMKPYVTLQGAAGKVVIDDAAYELATSSQHADMSIFVGGTTSGQIIIYDNSIESAAALKASLSGVTLVYSLATPITESATPYQSPQIVDDWGTERYVDYEYSVGQRPIPVPVGHDTKYPANLRDKVQHLPSLADTDGTYAIQQAGTQMSLVPLPVVIPEPPSANGTYTLKATVSGGTVTLSWEV